MHIKNGFEIKSYLSYLFIFHFFGFLLKIIWVFRGLNSIWWSASPKNARPRRSGEWKPEIFGGFQSMGPKLSSIFWWEKSMVSCGQFPNPSTAVFPRFRGWGFHWNNLRFMKCCFIYKWHVRCCFCFDYYYLLLLVLLLLYFFDT